MRGTRYLSACRHTVSVCGSTPDTASRMAMAPSRTRSERSTSMVKSTWPGVSMMLIRQSAQNDTGAPQEKRGAEAAAPLCESRWLPAVVRERLVGLRHLVSVFSLLHGRAAVVGGVEELAGQPLRHAFFRAPARGSDEPPHAQGGAPVGSYFHGHLVRRAAYPPRLALHRRLAIVHGGLEELE